MDGSYVPIEYYRHIISFTYQHVSVILKGTYNLCYQILDVLQRSHPIISYSLVFSNFHLLQV
jgi:hypothetical protein